MIVTNTDERFYEAPGVTVVKIHGRGGYLAASNQLDDMDYNEILDEDF